MNIKGLVSIALLGVSAFTRYECELSAREIEKDASETLAAYHYVGNGICGPVVLPGEDYKQEALFARCVGWLTVASAVSIGVCLHQN